MLNNINTLHKGYPVDFSSLLPAFILNSLLLKTAFLKKVFYRLFRIVVVSFRHCFG